MRCPLHGEDRAHGCGDCRSLERAKKKREPRTSSLGDIIGRGGWSQLRRHAAAMIRAKRKAERKKKYADRQRRFVVRRAKENS